MRTPSAPGETIADLIEERSLDKLSLADDLGLGLDQLELLLVGDLHIDAILAHRLSCVLGPPGVFWERREAHYRLALSGGNVPFAQMCEGLLDDTETTRNEKETDA